MSKPEGTTTGTIETIDFTKSTPKALSLVDPATLTPEQQADYAKACNAMLQRTMKGGILVDPRNGIVYVAGNVAGNVNNRLKVKALPSSFKPKKEETNAQGEIFLSDKRLDQMEEDLKLATVTRSMRVKRMTAIAAARYALPLSKPVWNSSTTMLGT